MHKLMIFSVIRKMLSLSLISGTIITIISLGCISASPLISYSLLMPGMMGTNMTGAQNLMTTQANFCGTCYKDDA